MKKKVNTKKYNTEYEYTGNPAIDLVASCISHYRDTPKKLRSIILRDDYYGLFAEYVKKHTDIQIDSKFSFENIEIECGDENITEPLYATFMQSF